MSSRRHPRNPDRHLLVAQADDLVDLGLALALLPADAYGAVIVGADDAIDAVIAAPSRMSVTIVRSGGLDAAVSGWLAEWMPDEVACAGINRVWIGRRAATCLDGELCGRLHWTFEQLDAVDVY